MDKYFVENNFDQIQKIKNKFINFIVDYSRKSLTNA